MLIWDDNQIKNIVNILKENKRHNVVSTKKDINFSAPRFVFVCGKKLEDDGVRKIVIDKLNKRVTLNRFNSEINKVLCIISEDLYIQDLAEDIFSFEKMLAEISEKIIIVSESPGSFCELGAFIMDEICSHKTIVINEDNSSYKESFITKGPIKYLENLDENKVILFNAIQGIEENIRFINAINEIVDEDIKISLNKEFLSLDLKSLIYEFANIVELFQPISMDEIEYLYKYFFDFNGKYEIKNRAGHKIKTFKKVINLMCSMRILNEKNGFYLINKSISCFNVIFNIDRKLFNDIRIIYLSRLYKLSPGRISGISC